MHRGREDGCGVWRMHASLQKLPVQEETKGIHTYTWSKCLKVCGIHISTINLLKTVLAHICNCIEQVFRNTSIGHLGYLVPCKTPNHPTGFCRTATPGDGRNREGSEGTGKDREGKRGNEWPPQWRVGGVAWLQEDPETTRPFGKSTKRQKHLNSGLVEFFFFFNENWQRGWILHLRST